MSGFVVDIFLVYQFIKRLVTPFDQTEAFKLGLIDADGKKIRNAKTPEEKRAVGYFDRLVFNLKRLLALVPGGKSTLASYAAALLLMREEDERLTTDMDYLREEFNKIIDNIDMAEYNRLIENAPANATGASVVGTGDNLIHWSKRQPKLGDKGKVKKYGQAMDGVIYLRRRKYEQLKLEKQNMVFYKMLGRKVPAGKSSSSRNGNGDDGE